MNGEQEHQLDEPSDVCRSRGGGQIAARSGLVRNRSKAPSATLNAIRRLLEPVENRGKAAIFWPIKGRTPEFHGKNTVFLKKFANFPRILLFLGLHFSEKCL
jgi:hypothetical protein